MTEDLILIGKALKPHGIRGEVKILSLAESPDAFLGFERLYVKEKGRFSPLEVRSAILVGKGAAIGFEGIESRDAAEALNGTELYVRKDQLAPLPEGEYYRHQLIGLKVTTEDGRPLGTIGEVMPTGSNDVLVVRDGKKEHLIPAIGDVIRRIDIAGREMVIHPLENMLDG